MKDLKTDTFLTHEELVDLTGYQRPSCMVEALKSFGLRFFVAADGYPRVPRNALIDKKERPRNKPNLSVLGKTG